MTGATICRDLGSFAAALAMAGCSLIVDLPDLVPCERDADCATDMTCVEDSCVIDDDAAATLCSNAGCDAVATCDASSGVAVCQCPTGFTDDFDDGTSCTDINECESATPPACDTNADCVNTPGAAYCECKAGYNGDGFTCDDNATCPNGEGCHSSASCEVIGGTKLCVCNDGYEGDGASCTDIDECVDDSDDCDDTPDACDNNVGGYSCACPIGYSGDGVGASGCTDIDECLDDSDDCDDAPDACANSVGGYSCACPSGYSGDGVGASGCIDIDECTDNIDDCDANAQCTNTVGSYTCACNCGYAGTGQSCSPAQNNLGNGPPGFVQSLSVTANTATAYKISVGVDTRLLNFGVVSRSAGPKVRFALYSNSASDTPGSLLMETPLSGVTLTVGTVTALTSSPCTALTAGDYWLVMVSDSPFDVAADSSQSHAIQYWTHTFGDSMPATATSIGATAWPYSVFAVVDQI